MRPRKRTAARQPDRRSTRSRRAFCLAQDYLKLAREVVMIEVTVNGQSETLPAGTTVAELLERLKMRARYVAVERNANLVPRGQHDSCRLESGDQLEIVTLVGGG